MEAGVDTPPPTHTTGIPKRLRQRLLVECKSPSTVVEIQAKLRHADLRRQQHYEKLSSKARPKPKSPSHSSQEGNLAQRLEAKLLAAEQKRLGILANAQKRLAMVDEVRQVAKTVVERRKQEEREKLGKEVATRAKQAEANRMLIQKAYRQRRASLMERSSMSLVRKMTWENKYRERVRAAISQKRAAAEKKRLGLLEAEIKRARARVLQARRVAKSVSQQREVERRKMRDKLEDRMQRAKRKRAEYLRQRGRPDIASRVNIIRMHKHADILSQKLARCWRRFLKLRRTTLALTEAYNSLNINGRSVKSMPFEQFAVLIESSSTLQTVKALLDRLESRLKAAKVVAATSYPFKFENIDHLLKRVASPKRRSSPSSARSRNTSRVVVREVARSIAKPFRYPVRVVLCAYMILGHPDAVLSSQGEREIALVKTAKEFVNEFELLVKIILEGPIQSSDDELESSPKQWTFRSQLAAFDKAWCSYLNCFVAWKVKDARALEEDLVRAACQLELSMLQTCKLSAGGDNALTHDMKAIQKQVTDDKKLLREKVQDLSGDAGVERMESALSETRSKYFESVENGSPLSLPVTQFISSSISNSDGPSISRSDVRSNKDRHIERPARVVRSLFREEQMVAKPNDLSESRSIPGGKFGSVDLATENELLVNEFLHQQHPVPDSLGMIEEDQNSIQVKVRETMHKAFWDSVMESLKQEEPNYDRVLQLVREVHDELCNMAPESWKHEITEAFDIDFLSQVLKSGNMDIDYLGRILEFTLVTLQKLSSPSKEGQLKASYECLFEELTEICRPTKDKSNNPCEIALIRGLQFVMEQIQVLRQEISKARIGIMKSILTGPHGFDYLRKAFANQYGVPSDANTKLPKTMQWLSSVWHGKNQEWEEHKILLSSLSVVSKGSSKGCLPSTSLRTGGGIVQPVNSSPQTSNTARETTGNEQPECLGGELDIAIRLGLLKLVTVVSGVTQEVIPETFSLNLGRIRAVQAEVQKLIVTTTSILVWRQILLSQRSSTMTTTDIETAVLNCAQHLSNMLDQNENAGIEEITEAIVKFTGDGDEILQSSRVVVSRMIRKCLQAGDAVFEKVSRAVYLGARGVILGGSGRNGRRLAEKALRQVGGAVLTERMVKAAEVLVQAASVSVKVHEGWYADLVNLIDCEI
ncbi:uncharacterized protein LOC101216796 isoform X2 [Cucumis sativus]|uniref:uncharacterized protein LOC101216796 isoform X2 n=1 Tax=Cucumis sativus TaxID=3659 RepID=UPI0005ED0762|nr:uncharacterized protein LOC101216796 isoform X2 [Cucumis sativus]